jgi:radical SAM enzyme (TIGR01210 family)
MMTAYPSGPAQRDRFVLGHRGPRDAHDPDTPQGWLVEDEPTEAGDIVRVLTLFLTGRECPWRCVMCDLWRHTIVEDTPRGAIPRQIARALSEIDGSDAGRQTPPHRPAHVKLYNAGSFFDPRAVPEADYAGIAHVLAGFSRVVVESHPSLIGARVDRLSALLPPAALEVAMGLETAHPAALEHLNKRMSVDDFRRAADALATRGVGLRVFLLVHPPFIAAHEQDAWLARSIDLAFDCGATAVSLIPMRAGNGAIDALIRSQSFSEPRLGDLERAVAAARARACGRVFADLWDLGRFIDCASCGDARRARLERMNVSQQLAPPIPCDRCGGTPTT